MTERDRGTARRRLLLVLCALLASAGPALGVLPASAHADLVSSTPARGASPTDPPQQVSFTFSEAVSEPAFVSVRGPDGESVTLGEPEVRGAMVVQPVRPAAGGEYTMAYRVASQDGHPISGEIAFTLDPASVRGAASPSAQSPSAQSPSAQSRPAQSQPESAPAGAEQSAASWSGPAPYLAAGAAVLLAAGTLVLVRRRS